MSVRVADFGLSRDVYAEDYYKTQSATPLPVKWLAPEALFDREFSAKTDVVSNNLPTPVLSGKLWKWIISKIVCLVHIYLLFTHEILLLHT